MQVAVIAARHTVAREKLQDLRARVAAVARRIVQEAVFLPVARQLQRALQPSKLPQEDLLVVPALLLRVIRPSARTAQSEIAVEKQELFRTWKSGK